MISSGPRVFTIPSWKPFLPTLIEALLDGRILDGFSGAQETSALSEATVYLPTRRAARAFSALFAEYHGGRAHLLPRIVPLGEADEAAGFEGAALLPPSIAPLERRLILTRLIQRWSAEVDRSLLRLAADAPFMVPATPADAIGLAGDLERLMDALATENLPWDDIAAAVETDYSTYFEVTLKFLRIAAEAWPKILAERGASDPAWRQSALIRAEASRLARERPRQPVIAAGSTGSAPATAALLAAIARLPNGAVVLPGLDQELDEKSWTAISPFAGEQDAADPVHGHPQAMLRQLLTEHLHCTRGHVQALGPVCGIGAARGRLLSEALRPADTTDRWAAMPPDARQALALEGCEGLKLIEAHDEREEALAAASALREVLETPGRTAALVTPDRALAGRVAAELARWAVTVEDSAGVVLSESAAGRLARLAAEAAALDFSPVRVLALLAHPGVRLGWARETVERAAWALEIGVLRGPAPAPGLDGLRVAFLNRRGAVHRHTPRAQRRLTDADWTLVSDLLDRLTVAFDGFTLEHRGEGDLDLVALAARHRAAVEALCAVEDDGDPEEDPDGSAEALAALFDDLALSQTGDVMGRFVDYPAFFKALAAERTLNPPQRATYRRLKILGPLEARLLHVDRVVLGGLDEGVWPPRAQTDAFLNRPMRARVGLSAPERRIGQTAHDFVQALGVRDAIVTRAQKRDGAPTVPSRFLQRLRAFAGEPVWADVTAGGERYLSLARALETPEPAPPLPRPAPKPDPALFPRTLSVTEVETLVRDPYAIFARHVLKLDPLDPIAALPGVAERGTIIHDILAGFAADHPAALPDYAVEDLLARGQNAFGPIQDAYPELYAAWWPRFERLAEQFVVWEANRRPGLGAVHPECSGRLSFALPDGGAFTLRARADRIEVGRNGRFTIIDYKTGTPPSAKEVFAGFAPQLTLEAAMLMRGGFMGLGRSRDAPDLLYVHTAGGRKPLNAKPLEPPRGDARAIADLIAEHAAQLERLIARYVAGEIGYVSRPYPKFARTYGAYDHLARVKEWSLASTGADG